MGKEVKIQDLLNMNDIQEIHREVMNILLMISDGIDTKLYDKMFNDVLDLFEGRYPGYQKCNTEYHDLSHTMDATLAMARLVHSAVLAGMKFDDHDVLLAMVSTLYHDTGYIQEESDIEGTGAKYTANHVERSVEFIEDYYKKEGLSELDFSKSAAMIRCTGLEVELEGLKFKSFEVEILGKLLGTADLLGQMADRNYIEKLLFLFHEFKEGKIPGFESEYDLLVKTLSFYEMTKERFAKALNSYDKLVKLHFKERYNIEEDLYDKSIQTHLSYIRGVISEYSDNYRDHLRRGSFVERIKNKFFGKK